MIALKNSNRTLWISRESRKPQIGRYINVITPPAIMVETRTRERESAFFTALEMRNLSIWFTKAEKRDAIIAKASGKTIMYIIPHPKSRSLCYNIVMEWKKITDIILISSFVTLGVSVLLALYQLITRKSIKKVAKRLLWMPLPLILMVVLISLTCVGRVMSNMHRPLDVVGGLAFAFIFTEIYYYIVHRKGHKNA